MRGTVPVREQPLASLVLAFPVMIQFQLPSFFVITEQSTPDTLGKGKRRTPATTGPLNDVVWLNLFVRQLFHFSPSI